MRICPTCGDVVASTLRWCPRCAGPLPEPGTGDGAPGYPREPGYVGGTGFSRLLIRGARLRHRRHIPRGRLLHRARVSAEPGYGPEPYGQVRTGRSPAPESYEQGHATGRACGQGHAGRVMRAGSYGPAAYADDPGT